MADHSKLIEKLKRAKQELKADGNRAIYAVVDEAIQALKPLSREDRKKVILDYNYSTGDELNADV